MSDSSHPAIAVVGSLNIDFFFKVTDLPLPGETIASKSLAIFFGGKGANQAISASRQGARVLMVGAVGDDDEGQSYLKRLAEEKNIDTTAIHKAEGRSGSAFITVDEKGENMIVTSAGANAFVSVARIQAEDARIRKSGAVLAQLEVPMEAVVESGKIANDAGIPFILNPSPIDPAFPWQDIRTDFLIVNEGEAREILEFDPLEEEVALVRQRLHELRIDVMVVTRGADDTLCFSRSDNPIAIETLPVLPVDTVGAGDAFAGCFAARIAAGDDLESAVKAANCAGALTTLRAGAQDPIPDREKVEQHLEHLQATAS